MFLVAGTVVLGVFFFICCVNYSFQKVKYKSPCINRKYHKCNSPGAWATYAVLTAAALALLFFISLSNVYNGFSSMYKAASEAQSASEAASAASDESAGDMSEIQAGDSE